ncbi:MAG: hypothetical protein K2L13_01240, partial [Opitutales bacterium]|nr:hypothetical protein [Opitutales bacterium]
MSEVKDSQISRIKYDPEEGKASYLGAEQSDKILNLNDTNCLVKMIAKRNIDTANSKLADLPDYGGYSAWHIAKAWEEICDIFNDIKNNSCKFFVWLGLAWLMLIIKSLDKFKELSQLPAPEEALKKGMSPEEFFAWKNIPNFTDQEIDIVNHDENKEWKLELTYDQKNGLTGNIINSSGNKIPVKITKISSVGSKDGLLCLHTKDGRKSMVEATDLLEIGTKNIPEGQIPLKQFFKENNIPTFINGKIDIVDHNGNKTDKQLTLSYYCGNGFTRSSMQQSINDQYLSLTSVSIKTVSQVKDNNN